PNLVDRNGLKLGLRLRPRIARLRSRATSTAGIAQGFHHSRIVLIARPASEDVERRAVRPIALLWRRLLHVWLDRGETAIGIHRNVQNGMGDTGSEPRNGLLIGCRDRRESLSLLGISKILRPGRVISSRMSWCLVRRRKLLDPRYSSWSGGLLDIDRICLR